MSWAQPLPCGTYAAYYRHRRKGEQPCDACRTAAKDAQRERKIRRGLPVTPFRHAPAVDRVLRRSIITGVCWEFQGSRPPGGYGIVKDDSGVNRAAHRVVYEALVGPIPDGLELDHLCRIRHCVNPDHLEPVTPRENSRRSFGPSGLNARKTHCHRGHEFTPENTFVGRDGGRRCRECRKLRRKERAA